MHKVYFIAGLSNGETATEGKGAYTVTTGQPSPYQRLLRYCEQHNLRITSLSLACADGRRWNLPSAGKNPKFKAFADAPKPVAYRFFRKAGLDVQGGDGAEDRFTVVEAVYREYCLQVWVDEKTLNAWTLIT